MSEKNFNSEFYIYNKELLKRSNLILEYRVSKSSESIKDGKLVIFAYAGTSKDSSAGKTDITHTPILASIIVFGLFDAYLDRICPSFEGDKLITKYDKLPVTNNTEKIRKFLYGIFREIRNKITHKSSSIAINNNMTSIPYTYNNKKYRMKILDEVMIDLYSAVLILMDEELTLLRGSYFKEGLLEWYYDKIKSSIIIVDDFETEDGCKAENGFIAPNIVTDIVPLNPQRELIVNAQSTPAGQYLTIENDKYSRTDKRDYAIRYNDTLYIIPQEHLEDSKIQIRELDKWRADERYLTLG